MSFFQEITLEWADKKYRITGNFLELIQRLEDVLHGPDGMDAVRMLLRPGGPGLARTCKAWGVALRFAGASVTDEEIYQTIVEAMANGDGAARNAQNAALLSLLSMIAPPVASPFIEALTKMKPKGDAAGNSPSPEPAD